MAEGQNEGQEKTEEPSGKKLEEARKEGQVAKSQEISSLVALLAAFTSIVIWGPRIARKFAEGAKGAFYFQINDPLANFVEWGNQYVRPLLVDLGSLLAFVLFFAIVSNLFQTGLLIAWKKLVPKGENISPLKGAKKIFGPQNLVMFLKSAAKVAVIGVIVYYHISERTKEIPSLASLDLKESTSWIFSYWALMLLKIFIFLGIVAVIDYAYNAYTLKKNLMMTKQELKDELKQEQVSEHIRQKVRSTAQEMARRDVQREVPTADVIITNPTHYSIAIRYNRFVDSAPKVVAKGKNRLAKTIRDIARENRVPLYEYPVLARALYKHVKVGKTVPQEYFEGVAQVLAWVYRVYKRGLSHTNRFVHEELK